ncbi:restriction endonuclease subunit S [Galbibacter orientalis]|uniref:restriction endonuclease subunit S n=1 Tax=Galbibacter orientalis TaxID=453852 RepID=UPI0030805C51
MKEISFAFDFVRNGVSVKQDSKANGVPITRIETIANETIDYKRVGFANINFDTLGKYENYLLKDGDILMSHINSPTHLGKTALYKNIPKDLIHGMNLLCLRPNISVCNSDYINYYFKTKYFKNSLNKIWNQSVNQASFSVTNLKKLKIPLPDLDTQKRIAQILDDAAGLRDKTKQLIAEYDQLEQSIFLDMFGDPVTNPKGWKKVIFTKLFEQGKKSIKPENIKNGQKYIGLEHIEKETGKILEIVELKKNEIKSNKFWFDKNYVLYGKLRPYLNKVATPYFEGVCSTDIIPFKAISGKSNKLFLSNLLRGRWFVNYANERVSGANLPRISPKEVNKFLTINPPIDLQNQFAEQVALIEQQKKLAKHGLKESESLFNCLLQKAFKGEL